MENQSIRLSELLQFLQLDTYILNSFITIKNISLNKDINIFNLLHNYLDYLASIEDIISIFDKIKETTYILLGVIKFLNRFVPPSYINIIRINIFYLLFCRARQLYIKALITTKYNFNKVLDLENKSKTQNSNNKSKYNSLKFKKTNTNRKHLNKYIISKKNEDNNYSIYVDKKN